MAVLSEHQRDILKTVTTATVTTLLLKQGIRRTWMRGTARSWLLDEVRQGASLPGLYPPNNETRARYEASKKKSGD
jgi:hypothetical protein